MKFYGRIVTFTSFSIIFYNILLNLLSPPDIPTIDENLWWTNEYSSDTSIYDFGINVSDKIILDLKWRLQNHRPLVNPIYPANVYGTNAHLVREIVDFWLWTYNWTEREAYLNKFPQFITKIQGLDIHFIHIKPEEKGIKKVLPLLILHGWPGSVREFYDVIDILSTTNKLTENNSFIFEIVVPSLPGFGFSQGPAKPGLDLVQVGIIMKKLMNRLGHQRFYVQGGDLGGLILQTLCVLHPESILGFHTNFASVYTVKSYFKPILGLIFPSWIVKPEHHDRVYPFLERGMFIFKESGYLHIQSTKPDSIGHAINDSPVGLASYLIEKFITGGNFSWVTDFDSTDLKKKFPYTNILDNLMYYWVTGSVTTSFRLYYESFGQLFFTDTLKILRIPVRVPTIILRCKYDLYSPDGILSEIFPNLVGLSDHDIGHFPAFENPQLFSEELISAIKTFEDSSRTL